MKALACLIPLVLLGCASTAQRDGARFNALGDVIELPASQPALGPRRFGFDCGVLLRDDFTRFHEGECQRQLSGVRQARQTRELAVHDVTPEG